MKKSNLLLSGTSDKKTDRGKKETQNTTKKRDSARHAILLEGNRLVKESGKDIPNKPRKILLSCAKQLWRAVEGPGKEGGATGRPSWRTQKQG